MPQKFIGPFEVETRDWWIFNNRVRGKDYAGPVHGSCRIPYQYITVDKDSDCNICACDAWLPIPVGKVTDFNSIDDVFTSERAQILQQDVTDKKFTYCAVQHCNVINQHLSYDCTQLSINIDDSCNLACPSCRRSQYMYDSGPIYDERIKSIERILEWLENYDQPIHITTSGNGDCLASHIMRPLLKKYQPKPTQTFTIFTNGLLIKKVLSDAPVLPYITKYQISVDAGSPDVYEIVRRPGKWSVLMENFAWLDQNKGNASVTLMFVIQQKNFRDLPKFAELCKQRGYTGSVSQLDNWATWSKPTEPDEPADRIDLFTLENGTYLENNALDTNNADHLECLDIIRQVRNDYNSIIHFNSLVTRLI
jgi:organic radical activating enzyme